MATKSEIRNQKSERISNYEIRMTKREHKARGAHLLVSDFVILISDLIRISDFGFLIFAITFVTFIPLATFAQVLNPGDTGAAAMQDKQNAAGVYVQDSAVALDRLALAQRMEGLKEWSKSAQLYQEILEKYADRVIPSQAPNGVVVQYTSVSDLARASLCKWPAEGLNVYRGLYETAAANLLNGPAANDPQNLHQILSLYFPTDSAKIAAIRLMDIDFESGDFNSVVQTGRHLLEIHPNLQAERPMVLYRTALAERLCGFGDSANKRLDELSRTFPQEKGTVAGNEIVLADVLKTELSTSAKVAQTTGADSWSTVGGDPSRAKISASTIQPRARMYSILLQSTNWDWESDAKLRAELQSYYDGQCKIGNNLGVMPAFDRGELFFQDNACIYGVNLDTGAPLPGWAQTYAKEQGIYHLPGKTMAMPLGRQMAVTLSDKYVAAVMYSPVDIATNANPAMQGIPPGLSSMPMQAQLICLDRQTGKEVWKASAHSLPESQSNLRGLDIGGPPLIVGNNLYLGARSSHGIQQFEDAYILCFDLDTGNFRWASYVASAHSTDVGVDVDNSMIVFGSTYPSICYASGRLFVATNVGAAAALDAYTGTVVWLNIYRDHNMDDMGQVWMGGGFPRRGFGGFRGVPFQNQVSTPPPTTPPWTLNTIVVQDGNVFLLPRDGDRILVYDADHGNKVVDPILLTEIKPKSQGGFSAGPDTLLGVVHDILYLASDQVVYRFPWRAYVPGESTAPAGFFASTADGKMTRGRGFVTADAIYRPVESVLQHVEIPTGKNDLGFPTNGWDLEHGQEGPGNIVASTHLMIIAGSKQVAVYTDMDTARQRLDAEVASNPNDPLPQLHYAEVMFAAWQLDEARDDLKKAFDLLGGESHLKAGPLRDRAFADALSFGDHLANFKAGGQSVEMIQDFYALAAAAAQSPGQQVAVRMSRAAFALATKAPDYGLAIDLYQQILLDDAMRLVSAIDPDNQSTSQAGIIAEQQINHLMDKPAGRRHYAEKYLSAANQAHADALAAGDAQKLLDVARRYPNSSIADVSLSDAASAFESHGNYAMATQVLRLDLAKTNKNQAPILESMARDYLKMGRVESAAARMAAAANKTPAAKLTKPLELPDGTKLESISLEDAQMRLGKLRDTVAATADPDLHMPTNAEEKEAKAKTSKFIPAFLPESADTIIPDVSALVVPLEHFGRNDRLITWSPATGLSVFQAGNNKPLFNCPAIKDKAIGAAWTPGGLFAWTDGSISMIDATTGQTRWSVDISSLPAADASPQIAAGTSFSLVGTDSHDLTSVQTTAEHVDEVAPLQDRIVVTTTNGRVIAFNQSDGQPLWQTAAGGFTINRMVANDDFTVVRAEQGTRVDLMVIDSFAGRMLGRQAFEGPDTAPLNLALSDDGTLVYTQRTQISSLDLNEVNLTDHGMDPSFAYSQPDRNNGSAVPLFDQMTRPRQLMIHGQAVMAMSDGGKKLRVFLLSNMTTMRDIPTDLDPSLEPDAALHLSANFVYVANHRFLFEYQAAQLDTAQKISFPADTINVEQLLYSKDFIIAVNRPYPRPGAIGQQVGLYALNRAVVRGFEGGLLVHSVQLSNIDRDATWQAFEGGIAYLSGGQVHMLIGSRK